MVKLLKRQANLKVPSYTAFSLLSVHFHPSILVSYLKQGQLNFALRLLTTINSCIAFPGHGGPPSKLPKNWILHEIHYFLQELVQILFEISEVLEVWFEINEGGTLYVDLLICTFCRGSNMTGYFPFPSRVGSRPRYGFSFCMVCTWGPRCSPVSWSVRLSPRAHSPNIEAIPRTIRPIMLLAHHCPCN